MSFMATCTFQPLFDFLAYSLSPLDAVLIIPNVRQEARTGNGQRRRNWRRRRKDEGKQQRHKERRRKKNEKRKETATRRREKSRGQKRRRKERREDKTKRAERSGIGTSDIRMCIILIVFIKVSSKLHNQVSPCPCPIRHPCVHCRLEFCPQKCQGHSAQDPTLGDMIVGKTECLIP